MLQMAIPLVFMFIGAAVYVLAANPKLAELGRLLFLAGAIALGLGLTGRSLAL